MPHKTIQDNNVLVHYWVEGEGKDCILFTHGATADHGMFQFQMEHFAPRCKVITWDVPAHGLSRPCEKLSLQNAAYALIAILDAEKVGKAHLVGQSMGGYICQIAANDFPERVSTLTAVDSSPLQQSYYSAMDRWLLSITPSLLMLYPYNFLIKSIASQVSTNQVSYTYMLETLKKYTKAEIARIMGAVYTDTLQYDHPLLPCPVLIICGEKDVTGKVRAYCDRWALEEKHAYKIIAGAAHNSNMDRPDEFNAVLEGFLTQFIKGRKRAV